MHHHERHLLLWQARRHERLVAEADTARALRGLRAAGSRGTARRARTRVAAVLRALASRLEPAGSHASPERLHPRT